MKFGEHMRYGTRRSTNSGPREGDPPRQTRRTRVFIRIVLVIAGEQHVGRLWYRSTAYHWPFWTPGRLRGGANSDARRCWSHS